MDKAVLRRQAFAFLRGFGDDIGTKLDNVCGKTGQYSVPKELFQKRTKRCRRALISWQAVKKNNLSYEQLNSFEGGVVVEFINTDYFDEENSANPVFNILKRKLGSDDNVSSIISIRSENGTSSSRIQREAFEKLISGTVVDYKGRQVTVTKDNYKDYALDRIKDESEGNDAWDGFLFISIKGGQQDKIETHAGVELLLFNPACEYASDDVCEDINLVMAYFALRSINEDSLPQEKKEVYVSLIASIEAALKNIYYNFLNYRGDLYSFVQEEFCVSFAPGKLMDPIQVREITIDKFKLKNRDEESIDITHGEAVIFERYYWDDSKKAILSPARPTNLFWSFHYSNMLQQNYTLDEFFKLEKERCKKREEYLEKKEG